MPAIKVRRIDFSPDEWIAGTQGLTLEEEGAYIRMIARYYSRGEALPADPTELGHLCNVRPQIMRRLLRKLGPKFDETGGKLVSNRCETELKLARNRIETARINGAEGGRPNGLAKPEGFKNPKPGGSIKQKPNHQLPTKRAERESLERTESAAARDRAAAPSPRPSLKVLKNGEGEGEPHQPLGEPPEGWLAEAQAARDEAGLDEPANLRAEWAKFAARADGPVEQRRWIEWALRAWPERAHASGSNGAAGPDSVPDAPWAARMRSWRQSGFWLPAFGPRPGEGGCFVPAQYLEAAE